MADWKQITARIRRARTSKDPAVQLSALYEKTHDAMAAFELAKFFETTGVNADAAKWYGVAAERFRRADWKVKAQEAAVRLGGGTPSGNAAGNDASEAASNGLNSSGEEVSTAPPSMTMPEPGLPFEQNAAAFEAITSPDPSVGEAAAETGETATESSATAASPAGIDSADKRRRRRGRRGGRNRRKAGSASESTGSRLPTSPSPRRTTSPVAPVESTAEDSPDLEQRTSGRRPMPPLPVETMPDLGVPGPKGRYGDPGLSSRISLLEMQFRRLLSCPAVKLEEANLAPVGPGVFVLTDSDLTSYYYVESCQTLRIAVAAMLRGNSGKRGATSITAQLAEHLGITEARVPKYLAEHCVVRWLQLDEGASLFAHFVIAVLRPVLNE
jgi:hypothetical protein